MKKCGYCAKEISYHDMYCCDDCEKLANEYYHKRVKLQKLLSVANIVGTCSIALGIFLYAMTNFVGALCMTLGGFSVGLITILLPTPTENMVTKHKLKKATKIVRIAGFVFLAFGIASLILLITKI